MQARRERRAPGQVYAGPRTNNISAVGEDNIERLRAAAGWSDFARSLIAYHDNGSEWSERQCSAILSMCSKLKAKEAAKADTAEVDLTPVRELFKNAVQSGYKRPTFRAEGLVISLAGAGSVNAGALYVKRDGEYLGKIMGEQFKPAYGAPDDVAALLQEIAKDPLEAAVAYGRKTGTCACCGRELTNAESIALGIGPICRERWF